MPPIHVEERNINTMIGIMIMKNGCLWMEMPHGTGTTVKLPTPALQKRLGVIQNHTHHVYTRYIYPELLYTDNDKYLHPMKSKLFALPKDQNEDFIQAFDKGI